MPDKIPDRCKGCRFLHTGGERRGGRDRWCTRYGRPSPKAEPHCRQIGGFEPKEP